MRKLLIITLLLLTVGCASQAAKPSEPLVDDPVDQMISLNKAVGEEVKNFNSNFKQYAVGQMSKGMLLENLPVTVFIFQKSLEKMSAIDTQGNPKYSEIQSHLIKGYQLFLQAVSQLEAGIKTENVNKVNTYAELINKASVEIALAGTLIQQLK